MTYGEAWFICRTQKEVRLPPKMSRKDATLYYKIKCRDVFASLGYEYKKDLDFETLHSMALEKINNDSKAKINKESKRIRKEMKRSSSRKRENC